MTALLANHWTRIHLVMGLATLAAWGMTNRSHAQYIEINEPTPIHSPHGMPAPDETQMPLDDGWVQAYSSAFKESGNEAVSRTSYNTHGMPVSASNRQIQEEWSGATDSVMQLGEVESYGVSGPTITPYGTPATGNDDAVYNLGGSPVMNRWVTAQRFDDHFWDFRAEYVWMARSDNASDLLLTTDGIGFGTPLLSTGDAALDGSASGIRLVAAVDFFSSFDLEFAYMGGFNWSSGEASAFSSTDSLYSVFSDFGTTVTLFSEEADQATEHTFCSEAALDSIELNARFRWVFVEESVGGAWILGMRYVRLDENSIFTARSERHTDFTVAPPVVRGPAGMAYSYNVTNDMLGFQMGAEGFISPFPSLLLGGDVKAGIYGNRVSNDALSIATSIPAGGLRESASESVAAFALEVNAFFAYRLVHELYVRGGYQMLLLNNVGLASDNFNTESPLVAGRAAFVDSGGSAFFNGIHIGLEMQW